MADNFYANYPVLDVNSGVLSLNSLTGALTLTGGAGIAITDNGSNTITVSNTGIRSVNSLTGALTLTAGSNITFGTVGNTITINASGGGGSGVDAIGTIDGQPASPDALSISGTTLYAQTASATQNGMLSAANWSTFNGKQAAGNYITALTGDATAAGPGSAALTFATVNANVGSFTHASITVNAKGLITAASSGTTGNLTAAGTDGIAVTSGTGAVLGSGTSIAQHIADATHNGYLSSTDWSTFNGKQAALTLGDITDVGTDGIVVTGGTGAIIGTGVSIAQHVADTTHNGYLSSTDWNTFNGKQASGNYITALTGDATAAGPGSAALTLATVNADVGSVGSSTSIPSFTVNAKGLITAASGNAVVAPAGTLTGTTLAANVVSSSLTSVGTISTGTWSGTAIAIAKGGTGQTSKAAGFDALSPMSASGDIIYGGASGTGTRLAKGADGQFLTLTSGAPAWAAITAAPAYTYVSQSSTLNPAALGSYYLLSGASFTITLPTAASVTGQVIAFEHGGTSLTQVYTFNTTSAQTIGGVASGSYALYTFGETLVLVSDGSNWQIAQHVANTDWSSSSAITITAVSANPTKGTVSTDSVQWRRAGRMCYVRFKYYQSASTGSAAGTGDYLFTLPVTADTNATTGIPTTTTAGTLIDTASVYPSIIPGTISAVNVISGTTHVIISGTAAYLYSSTQFRVSGRYDTVDANIDSSHIALTGTTVGYSFDLYYPANGWQP